VKRMKELIAAVMGNRKTLVALPVIGAAAVVLSACGAKTTGASSVGYTSAQLSGAVSCNAGDGPGTWYFKYTRTSTSGWTKASTHNWGQCGSKITDYPVSETVGGLVQNTSYQFKICGTNSDDGSGGAYGTTEYCFDRNGTQGGTSYESFTTPKIDADVVSNSVSSDGDNATVTATIDVNAYNACGGQARVEYGPNGADNQTAWQDIGCGDDNVTRTFTFPVTPDTTWKYRVVAHNGNGTDVSTSLSSFATGGLPMGFGIERQGVDKDWLGLNGNPMSTTVNGYLNYEKATWVNAHVTWSSLDRDAEASPPGGPTFTAIQNWATQAKQNSKKLLLSIDYTAPSDLQRGGGCTQPQAGTVSEGNDAIHNMQNAVNSLYQYLGSGLWNNVQLEIGPETNYDPACNIRAQDAELWWDIINELAQAAQGGGWAPGLGVVSGGIFTGDASGDFGSGSVGATTYLEQGIQPNRKITDDQGHTWDHHNWTYFDAYGVHTAHCSQSTYPYGTTWGCDLGINERIGQVRQALVDRSEPVGKEIEVTALIPTQTRPDGTPSQDAQEYDTTYIWNNIRSTYAAYGNYTLDLVIWNDIVDPYPDQESFAYQGFMKCANPAYNNADAYCATAPPYTGKTVYNAAHGWSRKIG
jgi:hypothetical protein